jgi:recombination protein RecR
MKYPRILQNLIDQLTGLPNVGPKTAERYAFYLLQENSNKSQELAKSINNLHEKAIICQTCLALAETNPCSICADNNRQKDVLCIVENLPDLVAIENTKQYSGRYFILGGLIDTINGIQPPDLNIDKLIKKVKEEKIKELVIALNFTLEGETTTLYLSKIFKNHLKITRLARGLPAGSDLEYADTLTLSNALENRNEIK